MTRNAVLLVEDNPLDQIVLQRTLELSERFGQILVASNGLEALELYRGYLDQRLDEGTDFPPLLVLLDINMPIMNGFDFLEHFRPIAGEIDPPHFILVLSSSEAPPDIERVEASGLVDRYLVKPLSLAQVHDLADAYLPAIA